LLYVAWKKSSKFIDEKAQIIKENKELKHIKSDLEDQKDELLQEMNIELLYLKKIRLQKM
jgi:hypothetical protein